jgi:sRNA-binding regulator protein Hfq
MNRDDEGPHEQEFLTGLINKTVLVRFAQGMDLLGVLKGWDTNHVFVETEGHLVMLYKSNIAAVQEAAKR